MQNWWMGETKTTFHPSSSQILPATGGTIYGMIKTTIYLPESLKREVARIARQRSCSEAEVIRQAVEDAVARPKPRSGIISGDDLWGRHVDEYMKGFGER